MQSTLSNGVCVRNKHLQFLILLSFGDFQWRGISLRNLLHLECELWMTRPEAWQPHKT